MAKKRRRGNSIPPQNRNPTANRNPSPGTMPLLPPGLTLDSFSNPLARLGVGTTNMLEATRYVRENFTADYMTMTALYRQNWVVKRLIDVVPEDMTKNWYRVKSQLSPDAKQQFTRLERTTRVRAKILDGLKWGRLYGGAAAVIIIEGHDDILDQPLNLDMVMPGSFKGLVYWTGGAAFPRASALLRISPIRILDCLNTTISRQVRSALESVSTTRAFCDSSVGRYLISSRWRSNIGEHPRLSMS